MVGICTILISAGCSRKSVPADAGIDMPGAFSVSGIEVLEEKWWQALDDAQLNILIDSALKSNFDLLAAWQRLKAAEAVVARESSSLFPTLEGTATSGIEGPGTSAGVAFPSFGLSSVYEIDLWGRIGSAVDAERFRAQASLSDYQAAAVSLSAEIAITWYRLTEANNQLELATEQVETNRKVLELIRNRFVTGQVRNVDILRQEELLEATKEQQILASQRVRVLKNQLLVLTGNTPMVEGNFDIATLPELPPVPETGIPAELIGRRPDVQSALHLLEAADRDLASAISNRYPRLTISAGLSTNPPDLNNLLENWAYSIAGNLVTPIIYGGRLKAEMTRNEAIRQERLYAYAQSILTAFREAEDALVREEQQQKRIESIQRQVASARKTYELLQVSYFNGASDYLDVLTALDDEQQLRRNLLSARLTLVEYRIALYRALAGSFVSTDYLEE